MSVLMPNTRLGVRRRIEGAENSHGERVIAEWSDPSAIEPGLAKEGADGVWTLGLDDSLWPVRVGDLVVDESGGSWAVQTATLLTNSVDPTVNWVRASALQRTAAGTEPADAWSVERGSGAP